jgi:multidrug efflux pump subunit AcrA (membrane-fusion protein)
VETRRAFTRSAPSAGVVTAKLIEAGSAVTPNQRLFDLADVSLLVVRVQLSELDVNTRGRTVTVRLDAFPRVSRVRAARVPSADPQSRLVPVESRWAASPRRRSEAGFLARVEFALERRAGVLACRRPRWVGSAGSFVYVVADDTLALRDVTLGVASEGWVEVKAGLTEGERVVVSGHSNLRPGAPVQVSQAQ